MCLKTNKELFFYWFFMKDIQDSSNDAEKRDVK